MLNNKVPWVDRTSCPCCIEYENCKGCPIKQYTGEINCRNTPCIKASYVAKQVMMDQKTFEELLEAIDEEIKFLEKVSNQH